MKHRFLSLVAQGSPPGIITRPVKEKPWKEFLGFGNSTSIFFLMTILRLSPSKGRYSMSSEMRCPWMTLTMVGIPL